MRTRCAIVALMMGLSSPVLAETLTTDSIITLTSMGLGDEAIIAKIKASGTKFDLTTDQMIMLKKQGVTGPVIAAKLSAGSDGGNAVQAMSMDSPDPMVPHPAGVYLLADSLPDPKMQRIDGLEQYVQHTFPWKGLYELSYGIDFVTIEFFFRGFLILAFARYAGKQAILPVAAFYCSIHFGKPLFECITSYFGGIILGAVVFNTRSIWGGLIVHLGIAWLMELAGYLGHLYKGI